ncbi:hypothetical protein [Streptomyces sp. NPDC002889]|uniref:hypothetical protein n=1 Tax=Streptomyces sp. NPDC002889 TaxID=3364669 RepID=UPI00367FF715
MAHATAVMDQMDVRFETALAIAEHAEDAEAALVQELGREHTLSRSAGTLHLWIEEPVDGTLS